MADDVRKKRRYWTPPSDLKELTALERKEMCEQIRKRIADNNLTFVWLIGRLAEKGILTDKFEMSSMLAGTRIGAKPDEMLQVSIDILDQYERFIRATAKGEA